MYDMSDEELEVAFRKAKANLAIDPDDSLDVNVNDDIDDEIEIMEQPDEIVEESIEELDVNETDDVESKEESTPEEIKPEKDITLDEEQLKEDETKKVIDEIKEVEIFKVKANGREYDFTEAEMKAQFPKIFAQAMDYTKKTQAIKPWRKTIDAIEEAKLSHDDINLMIDVFKGNKDAITEVLKRTGVDTLDIDTENSSKYTPNDYGRDDNALAIKDIVDEISADKEYEITHKILTKDWDERSFKEMTKDPELIRLLHIDVKNGMYDKVQPIAEKLKVFDRGTKTDLEYYELASRELMMQQKLEQQRLAQIEEQNAMREARAARQAEIERVRQAQAKQKETAVKAVERKAAAPTSRAATAPKVVDYLDATEEEFEDWYKKNVLDKM